jgi:uncharacterized protein (DUF4415 family)
MNKSNRRLRPLSDDDEAEIQNQIAADPDDGDVTDEQLAQARPFAEAFPELAEKMRLGGRPPLAAPKQAVSIRLDRDVVEKFRATGPGWQSRINDILKRAKV